MTNLVLGFSLVISQKLFQDLKPNCFSLFDAAIAFILGLFIPKKGQLIKALLPLRQLFL